MTSEPSKFYVRYFFYLAYITVRMCQFQGTLNTRWTLREQQRELKLKCNEMEKGGGNNLQSRCFMWWKLCSLALLILSTQIFKMCALFLGHSACSQGGKAASQAVSHWLLMPEPWIQSLVASCEIRGGLNGTSGGSSPSFLAFPLLIIIPPLNDAHLSLSPDVCDSPDHAAH
jgi:hypothetical protein